MVEKKAMTPMNINSQEAQILFDPLLYNNKQGVGNDELKMQEFSYFDKINKTTAVVCIF